MGWLKELRQSTNGRAGSAFGGNQLNCSQVKTARKVNELIAKTTT